MCPCCGAWCPLEPHHALVARRSAQNCAGSIEPTVDTFNAILSLRNLPKTTQTESVNLSDVLYYYKIYYGLYIYGHSGIGCVVAEL